MSIREWAEELSWMAAVAAGEPAPTDTDGRVVLTHEQMSAGERARSPRLLVDRVVVSPELMKIITDMPPLQASRGLISYFRDNTVGFKDRP